VKAKGSISFLKKRNKKLLSVGLGDRCETSRPTRHHGYSGRAVRGAEFTGFAGIDCHGDPAARPDTGRRHARERFSGMFEITDDAPSVIQCRVELLVRFPVAG
jgi:hypothetical protein